MKICLVSRKFDKNSGSAEWIYANWLREALKKRKLKVFSIEQKGSDMESSTLIKLLFDFFILPPYLMYYRIFKQIKIFHFLGENLAIHSWLIRILGGKTLVESYDIMRVKNRTFCLDKLYFYLVYKLMNTCNKIIAISSSTKKDLVEIIKLKSQNIEVIAPIYRKFLPKKINKKDIIIGYLGALGGRKRGYLFLDLAKEIKNRKIKNLKIHIFWGRGQDKTLIKDSKNFKEIIKIGGFAPENKIDYIYNSFDFFIFPSSYEGLGLSIIEAMMCGKPCFVLEDSYFPKEVVNGCIKCKNMQDILNKILLIIKKGYYQKISKSVLDYSKNFDPEKNLKKLIRLYQKLNKK